MPRSRSTYSARTGPLRRGKPPMVATPAAPISPPPRLVALPIIEAAISCFKHAYGAGRCTWRGLDHFKAYIWSAVVAHNMVLFARLKPA